MATFKEKIEQSTAACPASAVVRNYLATCPLYEARYCELFTGTKYCMSLTIWKRGERPKTRLFCVSAEGTKKIATNQLYTKVAEWLDLQNLRTQGLDEADGQTQELNLDKPEGYIEANKAENVIVTGAESRESDGDQINHGKTLTGWSCTEKIYNFTSGDSAIMNRWFPMQQVKISTTDKPTTNGGLLKKWTIPEDLIKGNFEDINILPIRGFVLGKYDLEFKMVLQANPFQACCVMLSIAPYSYGLIPEFRSVSGYKKTVPELILGSTFSYFDLESAIQRPHVLLDVSAGGEANLVLTQKYHRTFIRNFDFGFVDSCNPGIRGSNMGTLNLHVVSPLVVGDGNESHFYARVFYRFIESKMTGMTQVATQRVGQLNSLVSIPVEKEGDLTTLFSNLSKRKLTGEDYSKAYSTVISTATKWKVQGPVLSTVSGLVKTGKAVVDLADDTIGTIENFGVKNRKGFGVSNRDKPNATMLDVRVNPRARSNFPNGEGVDDCIVMGVGWTELTQFFEVFEDEPKSFKDFVSKVGLLHRFNWSTNDGVEKKIFEWNVHPNIIPNPTTVSLDANKLRTPMGIASSCFTNYHGTIELFFQFVKTQFHKGSVEVAIHFGRSVNKLGLKSSYVKVLNVQECNGFTVTVPYIYDTPVRFLGGSVAPVGPITLTNGQDYVFAHSATVTMIVLNELIAPSTVNGSIEVLVWAKGGKDFGLNFPHPANTVTMAPNFYETPAYNPVNCRRVYKSPDPQTQYIANLETGIIDRLNGQNYFAFTTQGREQDEDFNQEMYDGNRITNVEHMNFKTLLKMPIKLLSRVEVDPTTTATSLTAVQNYFFLPVAPVNNTLLNFVDWSFYFSASGNIGGANYYKGNLSMYQSIQNQITTMFGMYRGSMVYTFVFHTMEPVYLMYLPHDYQLRKMIGPLTYEKQFGRVKSGGLEQYNTSFPGSSGNLKPDLACMGTLNGLIIPKVNPTEKVVIPMSTQNNWLLMNRSIAVEGGSKTLKTMRENSEWFNGHICLWSSSKMTFDVYVNSGDDLEVGGFLGHPGLANPFVQFATADNWRVQGLDFNLRELTQQGWNSCKMAIVNFGVATGMACLSANLPPELAAVTGALVLYSAVGGVQQVQQLRQVMAAGEKKIEHVTDGIDEICEIGVKFIVELLCKHFPYVTRTRDIGKSIWIMSQHIVHASLAQNWKNSAFAIFCVLMETKMFTMEDWNTIQGKLMDYVSSMAPGAFNTQGVETAVWEPIMDLIVMLVTTKLQVKNTGGIRLYLAEIFKWQNYKNISGLNAVLMMSRNFFRAVSKVISWAFEEADPNVSLLKALQNQKSELGDFLESATLYLNNFNDEDLRTKVNRIKFLHTILRAHKLRLVLLKIANPQLTGQLLAICNKVIEKANQQRYLFRCDLVKSEPFVVCIAGEPGVGKSFGVYDMVVELLQEINYQTTTPDVVYTVPAGIQYWNGYANQPAVWYDDWCNLKDEATMIAHIGQLYALKTSAPFNVPRAELDNKEQVANPDLVILSTNVPFPRSSIFVSEEAVYRRRDVLVKYAIKDGKQMSDFSQSQITNFEHLQIQFYDDPRDPASLNPTVHDYPSFMSDLRKRFKFFYQKELGNKEIKYNKLMKLVRQTPIDSLCLNNPFDILTDVQFGDEEEVSSQVLEREVERLLHLIKNHVQLAQDGVNDSEIFVPQGIGEIKEIIVQRCAQVGQKCREWMQQYRKKLIRCENCHDSAAIHGTTLWCEEGDHYMCFHCGYLANTVRVPVEGDDFGDKWNVSHVCGIHGSLLKITQRHFFEAAFANIIAEKVDVPFKFYNLIRCWLGKTCLPNKAMYALVVCMQAYIALLAGGFYKTIFNGGNRTQGFDFIDVQPHTNFYEPTQRFKADPLIDYRALFDNEPNNSDACSRYICPHSLLIKGFTYSDQFFQPTLSNYEGETPILLGDNLCEGKCVLTNLSFLTAVKEVFDVSPEYVKYLKSTDVDKIQFYFPKFLHPTRLEELKARGGMLQKLVSRNWWDYYVSPLGAKFMKIVKLVAPVLAACGVLWGVSKIIGPTWNWIMRFFGINLNTEGAPDIYLKKNSSKRTARQRRPNRGSNFSSQASNENLENKLNKIVQNYVVLKVGATYMTAWGVSGSTFLIPKHLARKLSRVKMIELAFVVKEHEKLNILVEDLRITEFDRKDLASVEIKGSKILFKDCTKFMAKRRAFDFNFTDAILLDVDCEKGGVFDTEVKVLNSVQNTTATNSTGESFENDVGLLYNFERTGACGSLLCVDSLTPIVSMHISGSADLQRGIGVMLFQDDFVVQGAEFPEDTGVDTLYYGDDCVISYEASIDTDLVPHVPTTTSIIPSLISDLVESSPPKTAPAILHHSDPRYTHPLTPLHYGVRKNGRPTLDFPKYYLDKAYYGLKSRLLSGKLIRTPQVLSVEEAIIGLPQQYVDDEYNVDPFGEMEDCYYGAIPLDTSAGWPYSTTRYRKKYGVNTTSKAGWLSYRRDSNLRPIGIELHPLIWEHHEKNMQLRQKGIAAVNVFQDCLKDERRPVEKLMKEGGTRLFSMSNLEGTIALRRFTLDFTSYLRYNRIKNYFSVGINPDSVEWTILANTLLKMGNNIFTTDFSNFGAGLNFGCGMRMADLIKEFYTKFGTLSQVDSTIIETLILELMGSRHVSGNLIYRTYAGSPSGAAITVEMNCFVHMMYVAIVWIIIGDVLWEMKYADSKYTSNLLLPYNDLRLYLIENELPLIGFTMEDFHQNVVACVYGDDGIFSVTDDYREYFNSYTINLVLKEHGIGVTDATKSEQIMRYGPLSEATFLKRGFRPNDLLPDHLYSAAIEWQTVSECVRWIHKKPMSPDIATRDNCEASLLLAWGHGEQKYDEWREKLNSSLDAIGLLPITLTWEDIARKYFPQLTTNIVESYQRA